MTTKKGSGGKGPASNRNSTSGRFVTAAAAKADPKGTETEHNRPPKKSKK